jgi:hypothetical protein
MTAGQSCETQWMLHPELANPKEGSALPVVGNNLPYWGSMLDPSNSEPQPKRAKIPQPNLTFATLPLSFMGDKIEETTANDRDPAFDLVDAQADLKKIAGHGVPAVRWGWYQQGYHPAWEMYFEARESKHPGCQPSALNPAVFRLGSPSTWKFTSLCAGLQSRVILLIQPSHGELLETASNGARLEGEISMRGDRAA